jgi:MinD-like ATPase involved in chromosome partitioning or flagellar assembly
MSKEGGKPLRALVWSINGDVGKTSISLNLYHMLDIPIITNEIYTTLTKVIQNEDDLSILKENQSVPQIPQDYSIIFDFAGGIQKDQKRIISAIQQVDYVIVPTYTEEETLKYRNTARESLKELYQVKETLGLHFKTILVINKYTNLKEFEIEKEYFENLKNLKNKDEKIHFDHILKLKKSKALCQIYTHNKSIKDLKKSSPLLGFSYKQVDNDFDEILKIIN